MKKQKYPTEWNLDLLFKDTPQNVKKERARIKRAYLAFAKKWKKKYDYLKQPRALRRALDEYEKLSSIYSSRESRYLKLRSFRESNNKNLKARINNATNFYTPIFNEVKFFEIQIAKISKKDQGQFLKNKNLQNYKHFLEKIFQESKYFLTEPEEKILSLKNPVSHTNWQKMLSSFLAKEERWVLGEKGRKIKLSQSQIAPLLSSRKRNVRKTAADALYDIQKKHEEVAEAEINSILQNKRINDDLRGYPRADFGRHLSDDIDSQVVDRLIKEVKNNLNISRSYFGLRAKLTGLKHPKYYDRSMRLDSRKPKKFSYKKSVEIVRRSLLGLDKNFEKIFMNFVSRGQIDVYPQKGKESGAFCDSGGNKEPVYMLLNHNNKIRDIKTLAHEVGHGINGELFKKKQNALNFDDSLATVEVASTFMEDFAMKEVLKDLDETGQFYLLLGRLGNNIGTVFVQVAAYMFELELHNEAKRKGYLALEEINKIFQKHMKSYAGTAFEAGKYGTNGWIGWIHFRYPFYVYSYASGLLISKYLQAQVRKDPEFIEKVKIFLSTGGSKSPRQSLKELGVDITKAKFWQTGLKEIKKDFDEIKKLGKKLGKI